MNYELRFNFTGSFIVSIKFWCMELRQSIGISTELNSMETDSVKGVGVETFQHPRNLTSPGWKNLLFPRHN